MSKDFKDQNQPEQTSQKRDTLMTESTDGAGVIDREENEPEIEQFASLDGADFKGKKVYLIKDFINSDRISNRNLNALGMVGYMIQVKHGDKVWKLYKRRKEFGALHDKISSELRKKELKLGISMPDYKEEEGEAEESMVESMRAHCNYLKSLASHNDVCSLPTFLSFCEVSNITFNIKDSVRYKEGPLKKCSGGRHKQEKKSFLTYCGKCRRIWKFRWFILTDQYLAYMRD